MTDLSAFWPLFDKDEETVFAEMAATANSGVGTDDPAYVDTRVGSFFYLAMMPCAIGIAAAYSRMNEAAAAGIMVTSWDSYLDLHAESYGEQRIAATFATGFARFAGTPGTLVPSGTRVLPPQTDPDVDPPVFETTASGILNAVVPPPDGLAATLVAGGALTVGPLYQYMVQAIDDETFGSNYGTVPIASATPASSNRQINLAWSASAGAAKYRIWRSSGSGFLFLIDVAGLSYSDTGAVTPVLGSTIPNANIPNTVNNTGGRRTIPIQALETGVDGNVAAGAITQMDSGVPGIATVINVAAMGNGTETETDPAMKTRLSKLFGGAKSANVVWYEARALEEPGVGRAVVIANSPTDGDVNIMIMGPDGRNVVAAVVTSLQSRLDPVSGQGAGQAPIDHNVTVATPTPQTINVAATPTLKPGYTLDGTGGTIAVRADLTAAIRNYIASLTAGDDVIYDASKASFFDVEGWLKHGAFTIQNLTAGGSMVSADLSISASQVAVPGTITLS